MATLFSLWSVSTLTMEKRPNANRISNSLIMIKFKAPFAFLFLIVVVKFCNGQGCGCKVKGYIMDDDTKGTNVRRQPNGEIFKTLHFKDRCTLATPVIIHKSSNKWCYLTTDDICVEIVTGWVYSGLIYTSLNFKTSYKESPNSEIGTYIRQPILLY
jgi:hypothetical protein